MTKLSVLLLAGALVVTLAACQRGGQTLAALVPHDFSGSLSSGGL